MDDYDAASSVPHTDFMSHIHRSREILNASRENLDSIGGVEVEVNLLLRKISERTKNFLK
jgi:hypothetical protein